MRPTSRRLTRSQRRLARAMERRLRDLDRADARTRAAGLDPYEEWLRSRAPFPDRGAAPEPTLLRQPRQHPRRPRSRRRWRIGASLLVLAAIAVPVGSVALSGGVFGSGRATANRIGMPPAGVEAGDHPLGVPAEAPAGPDVYRFVRHQPGSTDPVSWDPCRPIHYATSGIAPREGQELLAAAFDRMHQVTGFQFVNDGPTSEPAVELRAAYQPDRYGERWAPILVAWTSPDVVPGLAGRTIGRGGAVAVTHSADGHRTYVTGTLFLDRPQVERDLAGTGTPEANAIRREQVQALMLHELGHVMGLDHVNDPTQLMFPELNPGVTDLGVGDRRGLAVLADVPCEPDV